MVRRTGAATAVALLLALALLSAGSGVDAVITCSLPTMRGLTTGVVYVEAYDYVGGDIGTVSIPGAQSPYFQRSYCQNYCTATVFAGNTLASVWEIVPAGTCRCKSAIALTSTPSYLATVEGAGPVRNSTLPIAVGASVYGECSFGWSPYPPIPQQIRQSTFCQSGGSMDLSLFQCQQTCSFPFTNSINNGYQYVSRLIYTGVSDILGTPDINCPGGYGACARDWCVNNYPMIATHWAVDYEGTVTCYANNMAATKYVYPDADRDVNRGVGGVSSSNPIPLIPSGWKIISECPTTGHFASGSRMCQNGTIVGQLTCSAGQVCNITSTQVIPFTSGGGLRYLVGYDLGGSDLAPTSLVPNSFQACYQYCVTTFGINGFKFYQYRSSITGCQCKNVIDAVATVNTQMYAGPNPSNITVNVIRNIPGGAVRGIYCGSGFYAQSQTCNGEVSTGTWSTNGGIPYECLPIDDCLTAPQCHNGATCIDGINSRTCVCAAGFTGANCQTNLNECASLPCANGGTCNDEIGRFTCSCPSGYAGTRCQTFLGRCASQPCMNGGVCNDFASKYNCTCLLGYGGAQCQTDINECASTPCRNGGTCTDGVGTFVCACTSGYSGSTCQTDVNECASVPCQNGGSCTDFVNRFTCTCISGYSGTLCQTNVNECSSSPCANGGTCADLVNTFSCTCAPGYSGVRCQTNINECSSAPCGVNGGCSDGIDSFSCTCLPGFSGLLCQTNVNECASAPCANGATCVDNPNSFSCLCLNGYSGIRCQTNINECASNPCRYGTCVDRVASYNCSCVAGITGYNCDVDINECATNNGGCGATSTCTNLFQSFTCSAYVVPGSLSSPDPLTSSNPFVLGTVNGQRLDFTISYFGASFATFSVSLGVTGDTNRFPCNGLVQNGAPIGTFQACRCTIPSGSGGGYSLYLYQSAAVISTSNETISYPPPLIAPSTLRQNRTGYDSQPDIALTLDTSASVIVAFDGTNFDPSRAVVTYGTLPNVNDYPCVVVPALSSSTSLYCNTASGSQGSNLRFRVSVFGQTAVSNFAISFPDRPYVWRISGCTDSGNSTVGCPTEGDVTLTVYGSHFVQQNIAVSVGGHPCTVPTVDVTSNGGKMTCILPPSTGGLRNMIVTSISQNSDAAPLIVYALPTVYSIEGCNHTAVPNAIDGCNRAGGQSITLRGINFGSGESVILVANSLCGSVCHDPVTPHRVVTCSIPSGTGLSRPVLLLQSGGGIGSNISLSYAECPSGKYVNGLDCADCALGEFSSFSSSQYCAPCLAGKYTNQLTGASFCFSCAAGRISAAGVSTCQNCTIGSYVSAEAQPTCLACSPGKFAAVNGSSVCTECPIGTSQPAASASTCVECAVGTATSSSGQSVCAACPAGRFRSADSPSAECMPCPAGTSQAIPGSAACVPCARGSFSGGGVSECSTCLFGTMAPEAGSLTCARCPDHSLNNAAYTLCDCAIGYYSTVPTVPDIEMKCMPCPDGAVCDRAGVLFSGLIAADDWWRGDNQSLSFFQCLQPGQCVSGGCAPNRVGPICAVCADGYSQDANGLDCTPCPSSRSASIGATAGYMLLILAAVFIVFYIVWRSEPARMAAKSPFLVVKAFTPEDRAPPNYAYNFKIILSYLQIATTVLGLVEIPWPTDFRKFISYFSFVNLDFIPWGSVQCVATLNFYAKLVVLFIVPLVVLLLVVLIPVIALWVQNRFDYSDDSKTRQKRRQSRQKIIKLLAFALFLMYPAISQQVLSFFICRSVNGESYLVADFTLKCGDSEWNKFLPLAVIAVCVYPIGIPLVLFGALYRVRRRLHMEEVQLAYGLAYDAYLHIYWWWEMVDMLAKLFLTSLLGFFPSNGQCQAGMSVCIVYLIFVLQAQPYVRVIDDRMCCTAQIHLFLILLIGATLQQSPFTPGSATDILASVIMFVVLFALVVLIVLHSIIFVRKYVRHVQRKKLDRKREILTDNPMQVPTTAKSGAADSGTAGASTASGGSGAFDDESDDSDIYVPKRDGGSPDVSESDGAYLPGNRAARASGRIKKRTSMSPLQRGLPSPTSGRSNRANTGSGGNESGSFTPRLRAGAPSVSGGGGGGGGGVELLELRLPPQMSGNGAVVGASTPHDSSSTPATPSANSHAVPLSRFPFSIQQQILADRTGAAAAPPPLPRESILSQPPLPRESVSSPPPPPEASTAIDIELAATAATPPLPDEITGVDVEVDGADAPPPPASADL